MFLQSGTLLGRYEILSLLGQGGMGQVFKANDARLGRLVAIKVLPDLLVADPVRRARFEQEARAMSALNHAHVCALYDIGRAVPAHDAHRPEAEQGQEPIDFLVMEYCDGETLEQRLAKRPLRFEQLLTFAVEMAEGVDAAHRHGLTHCDLKPSNIMLTSAGVKLLDFGVTRLSNRVSLGPIDPQPLRDLASPDATADGEYVGTPRYMAPEQLEGRGVDARTDLFSLGAILYEMATGRKAFEGQNRAELMTAILETDPPPLRPAHVPHPSALRAFERVVRKCLAKNPTERWQDASDLATELKWIAEDDALRRSTEAASRSRVRKIAGAVAVICAAIASATIPLAVNLSPAVPATISDSVTFEVRPPRGIPAGPIISPDGRNLAFLSTGGSAARRIWIKPLNALDPRPLSGTEGASNPFWSPDGRFIAFFSGNKLRTIGIDGGAPVDVCEAIGPNRAGAWNRDGVILMSAQTPRGDNVIHRVAAAGGRPTPITQLDGTAADWQHTLPEFLPDGRRFLYLALASEKEDSSVFMASLDSTERERLLDVRSQASYAEPGYLLYRRGEALLAHPFDLASGRFSGTPKTVVANVAFSVATGRTIFSASQTGVLVYRSIPENVLEWVDRRGNASGTIGVQRLDIDPAVSPDGNRVAVSRYDPLRNARNIWILDNQHGGESRLTFGNSWDVAPVWSRDGARVAYASGPEAFTSLGLYEKAVNGSSAEQRLGAATGYPESWTSDGRSLLYGEIGNGGRLWLFSPAGPPTQLFEGRNGLLSPDGHWLAYESTESGIAEVYVRPFPHGGVARWQVSPSGGVEPRWREDGRELYYLAADQHLMAVPVSTTSGTFEAGRPVPLFRTRADVSGNGRVAGRRQYGVVRDGQRFLINQVSASLPPQLTVILNWPAALRP